jgi:serine/threonine-protein kinase HipA
MTVNGKRDHFTLTDLLACARTASIQRGRAETIISQVQRAVARWPDCADQVGVPGDQRDQILRALRIAPFPRG